MLIKNLFKASLAGAALFALSFTGASAAPSIPCGTAKLIVPWGAGGGTDVIFRQMVEKVNKSGAKLCSTFIYFFDHLSKYNICSTACSPRNN